MTKYKLLKPIKNVEWNVGEVKETEKAYEGGTHIKYNAGVVMYPPELALLEHAGFIEEVNETPKRWRAEKYRDYFYLDDLFKVNEGLDIRGVWDTDRYEVGNYFQTIKQIEEFRKQVKALVGSK